MLKFVEIIGNFLLFILLVFLQMTLFYSYDGYAEDVSYTVNIGSTMTLSISGANPVVLNLNPNTRTFDRESISLEVATNSATGYNVSMYTNNDVTDLIRDDTHDSMEASIPTLPEGEYSESEFIASSSTDNKWGYKQDDGNFIPFVSGVKLLESPDTTSSDTTTLTFASKINYAQPSGSYSIALNFAAVSNPIIYYFQDWNACPEMSVGDTITLVDQRDGESYLVGKLADNKCWTLDNLRLNIGDPNVQANLNPSTTNATTESLSYLINGGGSSPYPANGVVAVDTEQTAGGDWMTSYDNPYISITRVNELVPNEYRYGAGSGKIGVYYNYCAASAGSYCYQYGKNSGNATSDVCPAGWRMPTGGPDGEYQSLYEAYSSNQEEFKNALSASLSGYFSTGTANSIGSYGRFWSSSQYRSYMYNLRTESSSVTPQSYELAPTALTVRCVLK